MFVCDVHQLQYSGWYTKDSQKILPHTKMRIQCGKQRINKLNLKGTKYWLLGTKRWVHRTVLKENLIALMQLKIGYSKSYLVLLSWLTYGTSRPCFLLPRDMAKALKVGSSRVSDRSRADRKHHPKPSEALWHCCMWPMERSCIITIIVLLLL